MDPSPVNAATPPAPYVLTRPAALSDLSTHDLVDAVVGAGYLGAPLAELQRRLGRHALPRLADSIRSGQIRRRWRATGLDTKLDPALQRHPSHEDIAQEAVMETLSDLVPKILVPGRWDPAVGHSLEDYFTAWCARSAINIYRRHRRALHDEVVADTADAEGVVVYLPGMTGPDPADVVCQRDLAQRALGKLTDVERAAIVLDADGWSPKEIADQLGISIVSVRARISRGRRRLAERYGTEDRW